MIKIIQILVLFVISISICRASDGLKVSLPDEINKLQKQANAIVDELPKRFSPLDCNTKKFGQVEALAGNLVFLMNCEKVEPYLEGFKITVSIGNPYTLSFRGLEGELLYGSGPPDNKYKTVKYSSTDDLNPGGYIEVPIIINPATPIDIRHLMLVFNPHSVSIAPKKDP